MASALNSSVSPPPSASDSNFSRSHPRSIRSFQPQASIRTVITSPPWARDEPPSPKEEVPPSPSRERLSDQRPAEHRPSDVASYQSSTADLSSAGPSRWWAFTRHRLGEDGSQPLAANAARHGRERSLSVAWLTHSITRRSGDNEGVPRDRVAEGPYPLHDAGPYAMQDQFHLDLPPPPSSPTTLAQTRTPGWETPWTPRVPGAAWNTVTANEEHEDENEKLSRWQRRKKRIRVYMLTNTYVPLLFRFVNITFTTSALAIGIRIRITEAHHGITGALGASPTLVIIFAPLTLVHVMIAIYLEYFGRPLGLWRTSGKLAHTLVEVVFVCAWAAALALSFDNFFTSIIPCASHSSISWYNKLPRPSPILGINGTNGIGGTLCNEQVALICLVGVGLIMYCFNLIISLYRIFEKVKYHPTMHS